MAGVLHRIVVRRQRAKPRSRATDAFEQVARGLLNLEELEYSLAADGTAVYAAPNQSRFNNPELITVLGDDIRRLKLLKGARAAIGRKQGFSADLQALATASSEDYIQVLSVVKPTDSVGAACSLPELPAQVKTALRTILFSAADVPGAGGGERSFDATAAANVCHLAMPLSSQLPILQTRTGT